jgi:hypothetical protein
MEVRKMSAQAVVSILALIVSLASFSFAWIASVKAARAEEVKNLLGEKETVGFGALKLLRDGLPGERKSFGRRLLSRSGRLRDDAEQRQLVISALMSACLFERSDRARALLYRVIEKYRSTSFKEEFDREFDKLEETIESMNAYRFEKAEFNPSSSTVRLAALRKVLRPGS